MKSPVRRTIVQRSKSATMAGLLSASLLLTPVVVAQESTPPSSTPAASTPVASPEAAPTVAEPTVTNLMTAQVTELPQAPFTVRMLRITLEPGAVTPMHTHHGPEVDMVESGELTIRSLGEAPVTRADGTAEVSSGENVLLGVNDMVYFPAEVGMYFENTSDQPAVLLSAVVIPVGPDFVNERITWVDGEPDLEGVSYQKLGDGLVQDQPQQAAEWTIQSVELPAGVSVPAAAGIAMVTPIQGNYSFTIDAGMVQVTRAESNMLQPNAVLDTSFSLTDGDAAFFPNGVTATDRTDEQQPLTLLVMNIAPVEGVAATPAELTFNAGDGTIAGGNGEAGAGTTVTTNSDNVNMRADASVNADVVDQIGLGVEMEVLDGPVEADDYVWYQVRVTTEGGSEGWMVAEFIDGVGAAAETPETIGDGTSGDDAADEAVSGTPAAVGEFTVGSTVVTNDENVRLRPATNTDEEALDALPSGTELTVTGEPVEAGDFTWLPVETADGLAGFVVIDFVDLAP